MLTIPCPPDMNLAESYRYCERLARREAGNFYYAFCMLPAAQRRAMCALYTFLRLSDDISDGSGTVEEKIQRLVHWRWQFDTALRGRCTHACHAALCDIIRNYSIPRDYLDAALDGVAMDLQPVAMPTFAELYRYCYHVASVVGLSCIHIWGYSGEDARGYAEKAGIAFQLTNILRDLKEDLERDRVYLPCEDFERFAYSPERLRRGELSLQFQSLMRFEVERARSFYDASAPLARYLPPPGRAVFQVMTNTYRGLLDAMESRHYDVFTKRVQLSTWKKLGFAVQALPVRWGIVG